jgi:hypothetical protein
MKNISIMLTEHAKVKIKERGISTLAIRDAIENPDRVEADKFDDQLSHFIKRINERFLRVIGKREDDATMIVISVFFDRRIKRSSYDKDKL